ncbi:hypothetical protein D9M70_532080 [compost metagenome]
MEMRARNPDHGRGPKRDARELVELFELEEQVDVAAAQRRCQPAAAVDLNFDAHAGIGARAERQVVGQDRVHGVGAYAYACRRVEDAFVHCAAGFVIQRKHAPRIFAQAHALFGKALVPSHAHQQFAIQQPLEPLHLLRDRGLGAEYLVGGAREVLAVGHRQECPEQTYVQIAHRHESSLCASVRGRLSGAVGVGHKPSLSPSPWRQP